MKVICIIRTSTDRQEVEEQKKEVIQLAEQDGHDIKDIIVIGGSGASAIKLDETYINNLNQLYDTIDNQPISTIYAWQIDRIGRNEEVLMKLKNYLISKHIQLVIKNPSLRLLNPDGSVNNGVELAFSLFCTMAKQEMETKKVRMLRGKKRNAENGKYNGGKLPFGYTVNENNYYIPHPIESQYVKLIFELFSTDKYSIKSLCEELRDRGVKVCGRLIDYTYLIRFLKSRIYLGNPNNKFHTKYPQLISNELYDKVQRILSRNNTTKSKSKNYYMGSLLIICPYCGKHYICKSDKYICGLYNQSPNIRLRNSEPCTNNLTINRFHLDSILFDTAIYCHFDYLKSMDRGKREEIKKQIEVLREKNHNLSTQLGDIMNKTERIREIYIETGDKNWYEIQKKKLNELSKELTDKILHNKEEEKRLSLLLTKEINPLNIWFKTMFKTSREENLKHMYDLVHTYIMDVKLERYRVGDGVIDGNGKDISGMKGVKITIKKLGGEIVVYYYLPNYRYGDKKIFDYDTKRNMMYNPPYTNLTKDNIGEFKNVSDWISEM